MGRQSVRIDKEDPIDLVDPVVSGVNPVNSVNEVPLRVMKSTFEEIARKTGRYSPTAFTFVYEGLGYTAQNITKEPRHVSGQTLCEGLRRMALEKYGRLAMLVLRSWGIRTTRDFGEIVYTLIDYEWMSAQPTDTIDDFNDVYDFQTALMDQFTF